MIQLRMLSSIQRSLTSWYCRARVSIMIQYSALKLAKDAKKIEDNPSETFVN